LLVEDHCTVSKGVYRYGNVNIIVNGVLEFKETPNAAIHFWAKSILVENGGRFIAGAPATPVGTQNGKLTIHLYGSDAEKDIACKSQEVNGVPCGIPEAVWNSNPSPDPPLPGQFPVFCAKSDLPGGVNDCFYRYIHAHGVAGETGLFGRK